MACGCRKAKAVTASGSTPLYEVTLNGEPTGRRFTSLSSAQGYARSIVSGDAKVIQVQG